MISEKLYFLSICVFLASCSSNTSNDSVSQIIDDQNSSTSTYSVALKGNDTIASTPSQLVYRLYGYDPGLADVSATLVFEKVITVDTLPTTVTLEWPLNASSLIRPPVSSVDSARFYLNLQIDIDMDGQLCNGDLAQDYSQTDFFTVQGTPAEVIEYYLTTIDRPNESCEGY